jgi:predicted AlkP superfamily pyrophosphatase or phosphodiesterase
MAKQVIIVICDGLWSGWLSSPSCNHISRILKQSCYCQHHKAVFPSVTRVSAASLVTGCRPFVHGLQGNKIALPDQQSQLRIYDVGKPEFIDSLKELTGKTLLVPALSELLQNEGIFLAYSNVSPGAAYFLDPDHFGYVYHRAGSWGPGGIQLSGEQGLDVQRGLLGDREMTIRFCEDVCRRHPVLSVLWLGEPDTSLHISAPHTKEAWAGIRSADENVAYVYQMVEALRSEGEEILLIVGSDHGMETAKPIAFIESELIRAGFKKDECDDSLVVATQGGSASIYLKESRMALLPAIITFLRDRPWAGKIYANHSLADGWLGEIGISERHGLAVFVNAAPFNELASASQLPLRWTFERFENSESDQREMGNHGYLDGASVEPFLLLNGKMFEKGTSINETTSLLDIAPTVLDFFSHEIPAHIEGGSILKTLKGVKDGND